MKLNRSETHDRLLQYQKQQQSIGDAVFECIRNVPEGIKSPFYVYGHSRSVSYDEKVSILLDGYGEAPDARLIWTPRISKPKASPNTYLFLCNKNTDVIQIIWMIPKREIWNEYKPGQMTHNENVWVSIQNFIHFRDEMNAPDKEGPKESDMIEWRKVYGEEAHKRINLKKSKKNV
jgi:hypothetical protein